MSRFRRSQPFHWTTGSRWCRGRVLSLDLPFFGRALLPSELPRRCWCLARVSNPAPPAYKAGALPGELSRRGADRRDRTCVTALRVRCPTTERDRRRHLVPRPRIELGVTPYQSVVFPLNYRGVMAQVRGIEPRRPLRQSGVLPLNDTCLVREVRLELTIQGF